MSDTIEKNGMPLVSIIIVTWNCRDHVLQCLKTIYESREARFEVLVRDNGSEDGTWQAIQEKYPMVTLIGDSRNIGFAAANNEAIAQAAGRYLLLLNPDTEISPTTISELAGMAGAYHDRAMIVPGLLNSDGTVQPSWHSFPTMGGVLRKSLAEAKMLLGKDAVGPAGVTDWAIGACYLLPKAVHEIVGDLDAKLFMYGEDLDYCWRIHQAGYKVICTPAVQVLHHGNVSGVQKWGDQRLAKTNQALVYFWLKHFGPHYLVIMVPIRIIYYLWQAGSGFWQSLLRPANASRLSGRQHLINAGSLLQACLDGGVWRLYFSIRRKRS